MRLHNKGNMLLLLASSLVLASCSGLFPSTTSSSSSSSKESSFSSSEKESSSKEDSSESSVDSSKEESSSISSSDSEEQSPYIDLPLGKYGDIDISVHKYYPNVDYQITVPYEGNDYAFPYPSLNNYEGEYNFVIDDSETVFLTTENNDCLIRCKYDFGGFFHIKALDYNENEIASIYLQINTTQIGKGVFKVTRSDTNEVLSMNSILTLNKGDSLTLNATYNGKAQNNVFSSLDPSILTVNGNNIKAIKNGETSLSITYSASDLEGTVYDYSFILPVKVARTDILTDFYLTSGEEGVYLINNEVRYEGEFKAVYQDQTEKIIPMEDLTFLVGEEKEGKTQVTVHYSEGEVALESSFLASSLTALKGTPKKMGFTFKDYFACLGTGVTSMALTGEIPFLVIPVWFTNSDSWFNESQKEQMVEDIEERFFGDGDLGESVKTFYEKESKGKVSIEGVVAPFYTDSYASTRYNDYLNDGYPGELGARAVNDYFASHPEDNRDDYDLNKDGKLDTVVIMYAANYYGVYENNRSDAFVSHFYNKGNGANSDLNSLVFAPIGSLYGFSGKTVSNIQKTATDLSSVHPKAFLKGSKTLIHEIGHIFGAEDLYYSASWRSSPSSMDKYSPAGSFSMQDNNRGGHDPFTLNAYGWGKPVVYDSSDYEVGDTIDVYLDDIQSSSSSILLTNSWNKKDSPFDEYLNLELYSATGLNEEDATDAKDPGIRLWHVDAELELHNNGVPGAYPEQLGTDYIASNLYDTDEDFHLSHFIRNDENEGYRPLSTLDDSNLFHTGDSFSMEKFSKQFKNEGLFDDKSKLGWEFEPKAIFHNGGDTYGAVIRLTRVDNTITDFSSSISFSNDILGDLTQDKDLAEELGLDSSNLSFVLHENGGETATIGYSSPDFYLALNKGNSIDIALMEKEGYRCVIKRIFLSFQMSASVTKRGVPSVYVGDNLVEGEEHPTYIGKTSYDPGYMSTTYEYEIGALNLSVKNEDSSSYVIWLTDVTIEYSLVPNHLL